MENNASTYQIKTMDSIHWSAFNFYFQIVLHFALIQLKERTEELTVECSKVTDLLQQLEDRSQKISQLESNLHQLQEKNNSVTSEYEQHKLTHQQQVR